MARRQQHGGPLPARSIRRRSSLKKKMEEATLKLKVNRETLRSLEEANLRAIHGGAVSELYTCRPRSGHATDLC